jgi:UDP-N-acetylmuramoyl-tripeptide--D-alanyl-D-alanine ligase
MDARQVRFVAAACAGEQLSGSGDLVIKRVCTDSRQAQPGDLFVALAGDRFDGHDFLEEVARKGVEALVVSRDRPRPPLEHCAVIAVDDTRKALGHLAARYRADFNLPAIAIAGSNGKTTTKELVASVLRQKLITLFSESSFNNEIGVPLTLLKLEQAHQAAVLEVGTNHPGELAPLVRIIAPQYGVITSIGREHLEFFGDLAGVAQEEGQLAELLPIGGKLFLNGEDDWTPRIAERTRATVVRAGFGSRNHWQAQNLRPDPQGTTFQVDGLMRDFAGEYRINLLGRHQVVNALFAIAIGVELGLSQAEIRAGLAGCKPAKMRLQFWEFNGVGVLDDAYNANADSMLAALQTLNDLPCAGRRIAVLGDMAELGEHTEAAHEEVGARTVECGIGQLFAVGKMAAATARGARNAGLTRIMEFADVETAAAAIKSFVKEGDLILLKASRAARFERIADFLRGLPFPKPTL